MLFYIPVVLLVALATVAMLLIKELEALPAIERKRRARNNAAHKHLYALRAHGSEAYLLLWTILLGSLSVAVAFIIGHFSPWIGALIIILLLGSLFGWLMQSGHRLPLAVVARCSIIAERLASWGAPVLRRLSKIFKPLFAAVHERHTVYEKDDLLAFIKALREDPEVRIPDEELKIAESSLTYSDKLIRYYMTPRRMITMISAEEEVGPILLDELYKGGFSRLPVYNGSEENIVGTLHVKDLLEVKDGKKVGQVMQRKAFYVHEDLSLAHALKAFIKTKNHLFMVVNQFQELVGLITIEDVLEQIIGQNITDEFDKYDDLRAVAALHAEADRKQKSGQIVS